MSESEGSSSNRGEYEVEAIVKDRIKKTYDKKTKKYKMIKEYLIKWAGYKKRTWEPIGNLDNCKEILSKYIAEKKKNKVNTPSKNNNKKNINSPFKEKKSPYLNYSPNNENNYENSGDEEYVYEDEKSNSSLISKSKRKLRKRNKINNNNPKKNTINNNNINNNINTNNNTTNNSSINYKINNNKTNKKYDDVDIDILDGNESPFSNKTNMNTKNEFYSDSSFEPFNNIENYYNTKLKNNLQQKRKRSNDTFSDISISIEDPFMKTENTSQNYSNPNHIDFMGISQISIPKNDNEKISLLCKLKNNNKNVSFKGTSSNINIPKEEIIKYYEKVLINYLGGKTINFNN